jgi:hypothetical protein
MGGDGDGAPGRGDGLGVGLGVGVTGPVPMRMSAQLRKISAHKNGQDRDSQNRVLDASSDMCWWSIAAAATAASY